MKTKFSFLNNKLHVLFLCGWYPSRVSPTNGDFIQRHARAVSKKHKVTVIHIVTDTKLKKDMEVVSIEKKYITTHIAYLKSTNNPIKKILIFRKAFLVLLKKTSYFDVVHLNEIYPFGIFSLYLKWFQNKRFIISEHWTGYLKSSNFKIPFFQKIISKYIVKQAFAICNVSNYLSDSMKAQGFQGNFVTIPNVVDTSLFVPKKTKNKFLKLLHISSLKDEHKNISGMLRVAQRLDKTLDYFEWQFIGNNGDEHIDFLNKLDLKKGKISFLEHQTQKELALHLQEASICISFSNYETFGIVIPEAIASGTPVIATNTGISMYLEEQVFCKVIPIKNEELLFQEILKSKTTFADLDEKKMHLFIKQQFSNEIISDKFSLLYFKSLNK